MSHTLTRREWLSRSLTIVGGAAAAGFVSPHYGIIFCNFQYETPLAQIASPSVGLFCL
jgi:hypothetical protein